MKRLLYNEEIEDVLSGIVRITCENKIISENVYNNTINNLRKYLCKIELYPSKIQDLKNEITKTYYDSLITPGEVVGIYTGQNAGEKITQLSISYDTDITLKYNNNILNTTIGEFVDFILKEWNVQIDEYSFVKSISNYKILSVANNSTVMWKEISHVSRHLPNGDLIRVKTISDRSIITTLSHSHLALSADNVIVPIKGSDLKVGDYIPYLRQEFEELTIHPMIIPIVNSLKDHLINDIHVTINEDDDLNSLLKLHKHNCVRVKKNELLNEIFDSVSVLGAIKCEKIHDILTSYKKSHVNWEQITEIKLIQDYKYDYVYDFTVPENETFCIKNGLFTHNTLNTFHSTGITTGTVVSGVPRLSELLNTNKEPKNVITNIYFNEEYKPKTLDDIRNIVSNELTHVTFNDVVKNFKLHQLYKVNDKLSDKSSDKTIDKSNCINDVIKTNLWYQSFIDIINEETYTNFIRCKINLEILYIYKIKLKDICTIIMNEYEDLLCVYSPEVIGIIDVWFDDSKINIDENKRYITEENKIYVYVYEIVIPELKTIHLYGIENIKSIGYKQQTKRDMSNEWYIEAQGNNLKKILDLPFVDQTRSISNNMWEIYEILGIEATRHFLIHEIMNVISNDSSINMRHIELLVDTMLYSGDISSISRYGIKRDQSGVLTKCSFEENLEQFLKAGTYTETEHNKGVSSAIITGVVSKIGTGLCDLIYSGV